MIECRLHCSNRCRPSVRTWSADYFDVTFWLCGPFPPHFAYKRVHVEEEEQYVAFLFMMDFGLIVAVTL